jgi:hypothetical protein
MMGIVQKVKPRSAFANQWVEKMCKLQPSLKISVLLVLAVGASLFSSSALCLALGLKPIRSLEPKALPVPPPALMHYATLPCTPKVVAVGGATYFQCGVSWFNQIYSGAGPTYIVVKPRAGY